MSEVATKRRQAVILAGGKGTRLGSLTDKTPKPLLDVAGQPFIAHLLKRLAGAGISRIALLVGPYEEKFREKLGSGETFGVELSFFPEPEPAGTGGALCFVTPTPSEPFMYLNGDSLFNIDFRSFYEIGLPNGATVKIALRHVKDTTRYGRVEYQRDGRVTHFGEKDQAGPGLINGGVYMVNPVQITDKLHVPCSLETDVIPVLVEQGVVFGERYDAPFLDIGVPDDLVNADKFVTSLDRTIT